MPASRTPLPSHPLVLFGVALLGGTLVGQPGLTAQAFSLYGYLASLAVHEGGQVDERAELGTAGVSPTGDATVYFEFRIDGRPVDPVEWLKQ